MLPLFVLISIIFKIVLAQDKKPPQNSQSPNIVIIPFKTNFAKSKQNANKKWLTVLEYYEQIHLSKIYLQLESINTPKDIKEPKNNPKQYLNIFAHTDDSFLYIDDFYGQYVDTICHYSSQLSPSYHFCHDVSYDFEDYNLDVPICAKDDFKLYKDYSLNEYYTLNIEFQHYINRITNISFACGKTGLKLPSSHIRHKGNLITQIHEKTKNIDYSFSFKYNNNNNSNNSINTNINDLNEGVFVVGIQSYEKKNKVDLDFMYITENKFGLTKGWKFDVFNIFIGNNYFDTDNIYIELNLDIDGFEITNEFYEKLKELFFQKYYDKGICNYEKIKNNLNVIIYCYPDKFKQNDINSFPELNFLNSQIRYNFTFSGNELFHKIGDKIFFKMIINTNEDKKDIIFGKLFIKKYQAIFNSDYKSLSFYKNSNKIIDRKEKDIRKIAFEYNNKNENFFITILHFFIGILILFIGIFFGKKFCNIKRRLYANELEDSNYVYESKAKKNEQTLLDV